MSTPARIHNDAAVCRRLWNVTAESSPAAFTRERLCEALRADGVRVVTSRCLRVCEGPVVIVAIRDRWHVVERVRSKRAQRRVIEALQRQRRAPIKKRLVEGGERRRALDRAPLPS